MSGGDGEANEATDQLAGHGVSLERVQRIQLDIDAEPMEFSEATIAEMLERIARNSRADDAFILYSVVNVLRGNDAHHRLVLRQTKGGKWKSPSDNHARHRQHLAWIIRLSRLQKQGWQTDAAVHRIAEVTGYSVSRVYAGIAEENSWRDHITEMVDALSAGRQLRAFKKSRSPN